MPWRWGSVCLAYAVWGCALLDQPVESPASSSSVAKVRSPYEPLVSVCECGAQRAERDLQVALAALETDVSERILPPAFDACVNALTGVPSVIPPPTAAPTDRPRLGELRRQIEAQKLTWHVFLHPEGPADVSVYARSGAPVEALLADLRPRVLPSLRAFESAHLASQLCHSTALFVAIEASLFQDRSQSSVVNRLATTARRLDGVAAATTGILLELRRLARTKSANHPTQIVGFHSLQFDGEFASDGDDVERNARRRVDALRHSGALPRPGNAHAYVKDVALPFWLAPRPQLSALCKVPESNQTEAVAAGLPALREGDLGAVMLSARSLYPADNTARRGLASVCALFTGNDRNALRAARDMVPGYSSTGQLLSTLSLEPG